MQKGISGYIGDEGCLCKSTVVVNAAAVTCVGELCTLVVPWSQVLKNLGHYRIHMKYTPLPKTTVVMNSKQQLKHYSAFSGLLDTIVSMHKRMC